MTHVDYGSATPETILTDRFGIRQEYVATSARNRVHYTPMDVLGPIKRLGLILHRAWKAWPGLHEYALTVDERPMHIRSYSDGRLQIEVDGVVVFTEKILTRTIKGIKHREWQARRVGDEDQDWAMQKLHAEALIENVRWDLDRRRQVINMQRE